MLWTITIILFALWLLGMVSGYTLGGWIHVSFSYSPSSCSSSTCSLADAQY
jgi:hypothetical protein